MSDNFPKLFAPGFIGRTEIKNRIVMAPMSTLTHMPDGGMTGTTANYYGECARGGAGLIICQSATILPESRAPFRASAWDDRFIPGLKKVARSIQENGARAAFQLVHHGRLLTDYRHLVERPEEIRPIAPSAVTRLLSDQLPQTEHMDGAWTKGNTAAKEASREDMTRIAAGFAEAARRIKEAGYDAVEIHGAHGYLISQFLSPLSNRRNDEYGGDAEKRARFACEVIARVREKVGPGFPIILRISGSDFLPGGICPEDVIKQVPLFVRAGADALHISASEQATIDRQYPSFLYPQGCLVHLAEAVKKVSEIPVIAVGKIYSPGFAEKILLEGKADFIALGRALRADPSWPRKAKEGRPNHIRPCIYCVNCLNISDHPFFLQEGLGCTVNPEMPGKKRTRPEGFPVPKKVAVVGGGPAGMEAARRLGEKGHLVTLYEQSGRLGGQLYTASRQIQKRDDYGRLLSYLVRGLEKVKVCLNTRVTPGLIRELSPDAVIVATGAVPVSPDIGGAGLKRVVQAEDVILDKVEVGDRVLVVGGRYLGLEIADQLAGEGKRVTLATRRTMGRGVEKNVYLTLRDRLIHQGVFIFQDSPVVEINEEGAYMVFNGDLVFVPAHTVVLASGSRAENSLAGRISGLVNEVYTIGDCVKPRNLLWAFREAMEAADSIS